MKLKVCGMRDAANIKSLLELGPDYVGMIFYPKSGRYVDAPPKLDFKGIPKVGVFVNATNEEIEEKTALYGLQFLQLHGDEPVDQVAALKSKGHRLIKAFGVLDELPIGPMKRHEPYVDYFLLDTKNPGYGGSGRKFDWSVLKQYGLSKPYFLSGGIGLEDIEEIKKMNLDMLHAIDVNSRFEISPAMKDMAKIKSLRARL